MVEECFYALFKMELEQKSGALKADKLQKNL
jgi:hypothetical protein